MEEVSSPSVSSGGEVVVLQGKYEMGRLLGHGTFGKVYFARDIRSRRSIAMKVVSKEKVIKAGMMEQVKREIAVMKMVTHPNIVELYEVMATKSKVYFAMELVRGGELFSKISRHGGLKEDVAREYFRQLISAVDFCHSRGVYHRDLKPENLLLDGAGRLKVADFGLSAFADHLRSDGLLHTACGTPAYVAPEVFGKKGYDGAMADLWSCGVILFVLLAGFLPFQDANIVAMYRKIQRGSFQCPPWFSPEARRLVSRLLDPNPKTRITVAKLLETRWFKSSIPGSVSPADRLPPVEDDKEDCVGKRWGKAQPESLNAFHIISLSPGFDLSALFEDGGAGGEVAEREDGMRFVTAAAASDVISRLERAAAETSGDFHVSKCETGIRMERRQSGRRGRLSVEAEIFGVAAPSVLVVKVKRHGGDAAEYRSFCHNELRPAIEDIVLGGGASLGRHRAPAAAG
ncbi:unnamed protein product [Spirodela intermedia]|uniref:non-specific serine/threonine protein kinase n=1 Tax=Spirodela intermedia TaxID=51605 RepID=A0A7I8LE42_SPIIN|nr:unnamed protein product [Spirodela intermedia]